MRNHGSGSNAHIRQDGGVYTAVGWRPYCISTQADTPFSAANLSSHREFVVACLKAHVEPSIIDTLIGMVRSSFNWEKTLKSSSVGTERKDEGHKGQRWRRFVRDFMLIVEYVSASGVKSPHISR